MMGLVYRNFRSITVSLISYDSWAKYQDCGAGEGGGYLTSTKSRSVSKGILGLWHLMSPVHSFFFFALPGHILLVYFIVPAVYIN